MEISSARMIEPSRRPSGHRASRVERARILNDRPVSKRWAAARLSCGPTTAGRLIKSGYLKPTIAGVERLARSPAPTVDRALLRVTLATPGWHMNPDELVSDAGPSTPVGWRRTLGWTADMPPSEVLKAACAWWQCTSTPEALVAVVPGGWVLGAWRVLGEADRAPFGGRKRFELGDPIDAFLGTRFAVGRGPTAELIRPSH